MDKLRLSGDDEDYFLDDDYRDKDEEEPSRRKGLFAKRDRDEEYYDDDDQEDAPPRTGFLGRSSNNHSNKVVPMKKNMEVTMVITTSFGDSQKICDYLLAGTTVVMNMEGLDTDVTQKVIDFTSGALYSINGYLQRISKYIFIAAPSTVDLSGDFQDILGSAGVSAGPLDMTGLNLRL